MGWTPLISLLAFVGLYYFTARFYSPTLLHPQHSPIPPQRVAPQRSVSMTIYQSHFPPVKQWSNLGVFDFLFTKNPKLRKDKVALIDATTGEEVRSLAVLWPCHYL